MAIRVELDRARGHVVGKLPLRFYVAGKLDPDVLEILDVDREAGHRAARQGDINQAKHPPLVPDGCRLDPRKGFAQIERALRGVSR